MVDVRNVMHRDDVVRGNVAEGTNLLFCTLMQLVCATHDNHVWTQAQPSQLFYCLLSRLCLLFTDATEGWHKRHMHKHDVFAAHLELELA